MNRLRSSLAALARRSDGAAAAEMALVTPMLLILMFGSMELGNYFLNQHAVSKQVRDGARFASRMTIAADYECTAGPAEDSGVYQDGDAVEKIINVTKTGSVDGTAIGRFAETFWSACSAAASPVTVSVRCVNKDLYAGLYSGLDGNIPVVKVSAAVAYPSVLNAVGFDSAGLCLRAESESAVAGL